MFSNKTKKPILKPFFSKKSNDTIIKAQNIVNLDKIKRSERFI